MKKGILGALLVMAMILALGIAFAFAGTGGSVPATRGFTPNANSYVLVTKGTTSVSTTTAFAIRSMCTADCSYQLNGTGAKWLLKANTPDTIYVPASVKSLVFSVTSSAGTGIYTQRQ